MEQILKDLNEKQVEAVKTIDGPVLIVAGPGSGKTKALTHRIAYMIGSGIRPENILAVTFTNKAADEMKQRIAKLLGTDQRKIPRGSTLIEMPTIGTFHSICARILRQEAACLGFTKNFAIYDDNDQEIILKKCMEDLQINKHFNAYAISSRISSLKSELITPKEFFDQADDYYKKTVAQVYDAYQESLKQFNAMDFDDLIMLTVKMLQDYPEILKKYQGKFKYVLVDEYQDTNTSQYIFTKLLADNHKNIFVIGDTDQSIYAWRNADFRNMLNFEKDFPGTKIIFLEQNYRSTKAILAAAQNLIVNNEFRHDKNLWTQNSEGEKIKIKEAWDQESEAIFVVEKIKQGLKQGLKLSDFAILYRTHAQSRPIEEVFLNNGFPYKIVGSVRFYERREVKDILAYLRVISNSKDILSIQRIYNIPPRGIGKTSWVRAIEYSTRNKLDLLDAITRMAEEKTKAGLAFSRFGKLIKGLTKDLNQGTLTELIKNVINQTDYKAYIDDGTEEGTTRWENVKELLTVAKKYDSLKTEEGLSKFLEETSLIQDADKIEQGQNLVHLMTLHAAKGLEFPIVFITGMEQGLLPHSKSSNNKTDMEEERRLFYVGITRAKQQVYLTFCRQRSIFGSTNFYPPSIFLKELPENLLDLEGIGEGFETTINYDE